MLIRDERYVSTCQSLKRVVSSDFWRAQKRDKRDAICTMMTWQICSRTFDRYCSFVMYTVRYVKSVDGLCSIR